MNLYAYVGNDPFNNSDPLGQETVCVDGVCRMAAEGTKARGVPDTQPSPGDAQRVEANKGRMQRAASSTDEAFFAVGPNLANNGVQKVSAESGESANGEAATSSLNTSVAHAHVIDTSGRFPVPAPKGVVDVPKGNGGQGDAAYSLLNKPLPLATISNGNVAWRGISDGYLTMTFKEGTIARGLMAEHQSNLNSEQELLAGKWNK